MNLACRGEQKKQHKKRNKHKEKIFIFQDTYDDESAEESNP
jgi:hypothetical protein